MKGFEQGNEWLKFWNENQKSLFQAWSEGKPPPFAFRGEPPVAGEAGQEMDQMSDPLRPTMEQWSTLAQEAMGPKGAVHPPSFKRPLDSAGLEPARAGFRL